MKKLRKGTIGLQYKLFFVMALSILFITVGFSSLSTILSINGTTAFKPVSMILITNIEPDQSTMQNNISSSHTADTINISCELPTKNDEMVYNVTIRNFGQTNMVLSNIESQVFSNSDMRFDYSSISIGDIFLPGQAVTIPVTISYKENVNTIDNTLLNAIIKFEFDDYELPPVQTGYFIAYGGNNNLLGFNKSTITGFKRNTTLKYNQVITTTGVRAVHNVSNDQYNSLAEVYAWIDSDGVLNWWSNASEVYFHPQTLHAFKNITNITEIDLNGTNTSKVENFAHWFDTDRNLVTIKGKINTSGLKLQYNSNFDYADTVNDSSSGYGLTYMFNDCNALTSVDISEIVTTNASDLKRMFAGCKVLSSIDVTGFDTSNAKSMYWMFRNCTGLTELDLRSFDTSNVVNMTGMFLSSSNLKTIHLGDHFDTANVVRFTNMFYSTYNLMTVNAVLDFNDSSCLDSANMFFRASKLVGARGESYSFAYNANKIDVNYAKICMSGKQGYFTHSGDVDLYIITYNLNGGTAHNPTSYYQASNTIVLEAPTREGYTFIGWTGSNGNDPQLSVSIPNGSVGNKNYTANYTPNTYYVQFSSNGGTGSMPIETFTYDELKALTTNTFTRDGYRFARWNTQADGSGIDYNDGQNVTNVTSSGTITLYAQWVDNTDTFPVVFNVNGPCIFHGSASNITGENCAAYSNTKYINSNISLFSSENIDKDFEIGLTIDYYRPNDQNETQASFMNSKYENSGASYPGFVLRRSDTNIDLAGRFGNNRKTLMTAYDQFTSIRIIRKDKKIYTSINGGPITLYADITSYNGTFNTPVTFGSSLNSSGSPMRYVNNVTMSNMYIKLGTMETLE